MEEISYINRLRNELNLIENYFSSLITTSSIKVEIVQENPFNYLGEGRPINIQRKFSYTWTPITPDQRRIQSKASDLSNKWCVDLAAICKDIFSEKELSDTRNIFQFWICFRYRKNMRMPNTIEEAQLQLKDTFISLNRMLKTIEDHFETSIILVPDTNALIYCPEISLYSKLIQNQKCTIIIPSTVISELDVLKVRYAEKDFGNKVKGVIKRLKGWRNQGDILTGVTVNKNITFKMIAKEPNFHETLQWLDRDNNDDRVIATVIEIQRENPTSLVYLVTSDLNLQNKCELAKIPYKESPELKENE